MRFPPGSTPSATRVHLRWSFQIVTLVCFSVGYRLYVICYSKFSLTYFTWIDAGLQELRQQKKSVQIQQILFTTSPHNLLATHTRITPVQSYVFRFSKQDYGLGWCPRWNTGYHHTHWRRGSVWRPYHFHTGWNFDIAYSCAEVPHEVVSERQRQYSWMRCLIQL